MKRLIICCDGTWNNPEQEDNGISSPTNVVKIYNALEHDNNNQIRQLTYYHPGVGGEDSGIIDAVLGGVFGVGISRHIRSAYYWLANNYVEGDHIYLFGFSRGAFAVRSLAGMLSRGLLDLRSTPADESRTRVRKAYKYGYRNKTASLLDWAESDWSFFNNRGTTPIHFIGVWETVGALGVPDDLELFNLLDNNENWQFHDTSLGNNVTHARHAMALDEVRSSFSVTRWKNAKSHADAVEIWFPGVHGDVGGGYSESDLSNGALKWMIEQSAAQGLEFRNGVAESIKCNSLGVMHNSYKGVFSKLRSRPRNVIAMTTENAHQFHSSAIERQAVSPIEYPAYHPTTILTVGEAITIDVYANKRWNATPIFMDEGHNYTFSATGKWKDSNDSCDWRGTENDDFTFGDMVRATSSFLGKFETLFRRMTKNNSTDFLGTKRVEKLKWFTLVGAITNDGGSGISVKNDGSAAPHEYVELAASEDPATPLRISKPGYLYCFPNDVWSLYGNNHGSIQLTIKRVA